MSKDWANDINQMHIKFGVHQWFHEHKNDSELMEKYLHFRLMMCKEELEETITAFENQDNEEIVDGLIDMCVFAIGTLNVFGVDANLAWDRVHKANMNKNTGIKEERPNPFGLPDLIKPEGWQAPSHIDNHGDLDLTNTD